MLGGSLLFTSPLYAGVDTEVVPAPVAPAESNVEFNVYGGYHTIYEFRGAHLGDDMLDGGLDISGDIGHDLTLSGGLWYAYVLGDSYQDSFNELDLFVNLAKRFGKVTTSVGFTYYSFPDDSGDVTSEFNFGLAVDDVVYGIGLSASYAYDFDVIDGGYLELEANRGFEVNDQLSVELSAGVSWSFDYNPERPAGGDNRFDGFNHWFLKAAAPWKFYGDFTLTPYVKYINVADDFATEIDTFASDDHFFGGVSLSYSF